MSAHDFIEDYRYIMFHEPLDVNTGNQLSIPNNIQAHMNADGIHPMSCG